MMEILLNANQHVPQAMGQRIGDPPPGRHEANLIDEQREKYVCEAHLST
jgi:hypothetical protein